jgi:hypothetical protein
MNILKVALALGLALGTPAFAEGDRYAVAGFDDADAFEDLFDAFQTAVADGDKAGVADIVAFPITVNAPGGKKKKKGRPEVIATYKDLKEAWPRVFTPKVKKALAGQSVEKLFVNSKGVMVGEGALWFLSVEGQEKPSLVVNPD